MIKQKVMAIVLVITLFMMVFPVPGMATQGMPARIFYQSDYDQATEPSDGGLLVYPKSNQIELIKENEKGYLEIKMANPVREDAFVDVSTKGDVRYVVIECSLSNEISGINGVIYGARKNGKLLEIKTDGSVIVPKTGESIAKIENGKWVNLAIVNDLQNNTYDVYVEGKKVKEAVEVVGAAETISPTLARVWINKVGAGTNLLIDNFNVYEGKEPWDLAGTPPTMLPGETAPDGKITDKEVERQFVEQNMEGVYPRLVTSKNHLEVIKQNLLDKEPIMTKVFEEMEKRAKKSLELPIPSWGLDSAELRIPTLHDYTPKMVELAIMYNLTGEQRYAQKVWLLSEAISNYKDWGANRHFLDTGVAAANMALVYDLLDDYFSLEQKEVIKNGLMELALKPGRIAFDKNEWWSKDPNNWSGICNAGLMMAAMVLFEEDPAFCSKMVADALNNMDNYIKAFEPAGQSVEGIMYWDYGLMYAELGLESCINVLGTDFGKSDTQGLKKAGMFPIYTSGPVSGLSVGDDPVKQRRSRTRMWLAKRFENPAVQQYQEEFADDWRDLIFYTPEYYGLDLGEQQLPLDNYMPGLEQIGFRSSWNHTEANFVGVHAGDNKASHAHLDAGQFDIQAKGKTWIMGSLGRDDYQIPGYFNNNVYPAYTDAKDVQGEAARWHIYRMRTESKSCVVINGDGEADIRPEQDPTGVASIEEMISKPKGAYTVLDLTNPYNRDAKSYKRGVMLHENREIITVQDEITTQSDQAKVWWLANTPAQVTLAEDGQSAILQLGTDRMYVSLECSSPASFKVMPTTYLPGEAFPNTPNNTVNTQNKLAIEIENVKDVTIAVHFIGLEPWESVPSIEIPQMKALEEWSIEDGEIPSQGNKPEIKQISIEGQSLEGFDPKQNKYTYVTSVENQEALRIEVDTEHQYEIKETKQGVIIELVDLDGNKNAYIIDILRIGLPKPEKELQIHSVTASAIPQPENHPNNTIDGVVAEESRWSAEGEQWLAFDLGEIQRVEYVALAVMRGNERIQFFSIETSEDGENYSEVYKGNTSGTTNGMEGIKVQSSNARYIKFKGYGNSFNSWNSIMEFKAYGAAKIQEPSATMQVPDQVKHGETFEVLIGLEGIEDNIYAKDMVFVYDKNLIEFVKCEEIAPSSYLEAVENDGSLRVLVATEEGLKNNQVNMKLVFKANEMSTTTTTAISVQSGALGVVELGDSYKQEIKGITQELSILGGSETVDKTLLTQAITEAEELVLQAVVGDLPGQYPQEAKDELESGIQVAKRIEEASNNQYEINQAVIQLRENIKEFKEAMIKAEIGDVSEDGRIDVADLALVAYYYKATSQSDNWDEAKIADVNQDNEIDLKDLTTIANKILTK